MGAGDIYTGFWRDYSRGAADGLTLTVTATNGALLTAFFALFVSFVGARCWDIVKFALHQRGATSALKDGLHYQSQVLLASTAAEPPLTYGILRLSWAWRRKGWAILIRTAPLALIAVTHFVAFTAAGLFSSRIALNQSGVNNVLLKNSSCGLLVSQGISSTERRDQAIWQYNIEGIRDSLQYVDKCYESTAASSDCNLFAARKIEFNTTHNIGCPFEPSAYRCCFPLSNEECEKNNKRAIQFDTGKIDSLSLGINAPPEHRISYRKLTTCSPINIFENEAETKKGQKTPWDDILEIRIGPGFTAQHGNLTFMYPFASQFDILDTSVFAQTWFATDPLYKQPIPAFRRSDADVTVVFIRANSVSYFDPVDDPIFTAHYPKTLDNGLQVYLPDYYATTIGCIDQHQICNSQNGKCTPLLGGNYNDLTGLNPLQSALTQLELNPIQTITATRFIVTLTLSENTIGRVPNTFPNQALKAQDLSTADVLSYGLPADQWVIETRRWFAASLANFQYNLMLWANKRDGLPTGFTVIPYETSSSLEQQCHQQITRANGSYQSFSVLGLAILLSVGIFLIGCSILVEPVTAFLQVHFHKGEGKLRQRVADDLWNLQKSVFENTGRGTWETGISGVPTTTDASTTFLHICEDQSGKV